MVVWAQKEGDRIARPAKSTRVKTGTITKEEEAQRLELEDKLRGKNDKLVPPLYLTESQMGIFNYIMAELPTSWVTWTCSF